MSNNKKVNQQNLNQLTQQIHNMMDSMTPEQIVEMYMKLGLSNGDADPPLNVKKVTKYVTTIQNASSLQEIPLKYIQTLCCFCTTEVYMRKLFEIGIADALKKVIQFLKPTIFGNASAVTEGKKKSAATLLGDKTKAISYCHYILFSIGELGMNDQNRVEMSRAHFVSYTSDFLKEVQSTGNPNGVYDHLIASGWKIIAEICYNEFAIQEFVEHKCLELAIDQLQDKPIRILCFQKIGEQIAESSTNFNVAKNLLRVISVLCHSPPLKLQLINYKNGILLQKLQSCLKSTDSMVSNTAQSILSMLQGKTKTVETKVGISASEYSSAFSKESKVQKCFVCQKEETPDHFLKKCSACKNILYCSRECQVKDWNRHKQECNKQK